VLRQVVDEPRELAEQRTWEATLDAVQVVLDEAAFATAWSAGQALTLDEAIAEALAEAEAEPADET
jgi:hypothetical protein